MQDFSGQRLRRKSFQDQDLSGANFTRADLRGANFTRANLTGANFTQAQLGLPPFHRVLLLVAAGVGAVLSSGFTFFLGHLITYLQDSQTPPQTLPLLFGLLAFLLLITLRLGVDALNSWLMRLLVVLVILVSMILSGYAAWGC
jgi:Pentapeptide repeats (8 copies)